jgi:hypothetical protein
MTIKLKLAVLAVALGTAFSAQATALTYWNGGSGLSGGGTFVETVDAPFGGALLKSMSSAAIGSGTFRSAVYENTAGTLDFYYQVAKTSSVAKGVWGEGWLMDVSQFGNFGGHEGHISGDGTPDGPTHIEGYEPGVPLDVYQTSAAFGIFSAGTVKVDQADRTSSTYFDYPGPGARDGTDIHFGLSRDMGSDPAVDTTFTQIIRTPLRARVLNPAGDVIAFRYEVAENSLTIGDAAMRRDGFFGHAIYSSAAAIVPAIPEPETYALMLAGLGLIGSIVHRRKAKQGSPNRSINLEGASA